MKKALIGIGIAAGFLGLGVLVSCGIILLLAVLFVSGLEAEHAAMDDHAVAAMTDTSLSSYAEFAPWNDLTIEGTLTAFQFNRYAAHETIPDLYAGVMDAIASTEGWQVAPVTAAEYAAHLRTACPEAAFLLPKADMAFDAQYSSGNVRAWFDRESGLFIRLRTDRQPHAGSVHADRLTIPHTGFLYELETHGGFLGDGRTYRAFIVPETERATLELTLTAHADWHTGTITAAEYRTLHDQAFYAIPPLYPAENVIFEWWSYVDTYERMYPDKADDDLPDDDFPAVMAEGGAHQSGNWLCALYDVDTGLFIYYEWDS